MGNISGEATTVSGNIFSWGNAMHKFSDDTFAHRLQVVQLEYLAESRVASQVVAENYVGLPFDGRCAAWRA